MAELDYSDEEYRVRLLDGIKQFSRRKEISDDNGRNFRNMFPICKMDAEKDEEYSENLRIDQEKGDGIRRTSQCNFLYGRCTATGSGYCKKIRSANICRDTECTRIVVEKPFGHDLESAHELNELLMSMFDEKQIYRIDHYLGKETVQNILALRFANALFEPIWNRNYIDHVQITAAETVGAEGRGAYYEGAGTLRDMVQNHILQLLCMIAMEAPVSFDANEIRNKKVDVLNAIRKISRDEVGQICSARTI